jgi:ATP-dependent Clp protease ATP-binding subunit ClpA
VARQLAQLLGIPLQRFDMSEYMERHSVSRLIGAPPGYVGYDQGGLLTDAVDQHPHCVLLLDEIEKAHPDLFNILLQVMDHGKLTDHNGKQVDFRNVILIMTTNAGAADLAKAPIGFNRVKREGEDQEAINRLFTPEFRNRLDAVVAFQNLPIEVIRQVVTKFVMQLEAQLADRNVTFELDAAAIDWLATHGYDRQMGARPLGRIIQEHIKKPLADEVLFGKLKRGGVVKVTVGKSAEGADELKLESLSAVTAVAAPAPEPEVKAKAKAKKPAKAKKTPKSGVPALSRPRAIVPLDPSAE